MVGGLEHSHHMPMSHYIRIIFEYNSHLYCNFSRSINELVGGLEHFFIFPYIGNVIIPTDFHIFQRGRAQPPTRYTTPNGEHMPGERRSMSRED